MKLQHLLLLTAFIACSCEKDKDDAPEVETLPISQIEYSPATDKTLVTVEGRLHGTTSERGFILCKGNKFDFTKVPVPMDQDFRCVFDELENGLIYYVKAYALAGSRAIYGEELSFTASVQPVVEDATDYTVNLTGTTLLAEGRIVSTGGETLSQYGIYLGTEADPRQTRYEGSNLSEGTFSIDLRGLDFNADYVISFFAANKQGEMRTEPHAFHTPDLTAPVVGIAEFTEVNPTSVTLRVQVTNDGGDPDYSFGLRYGDSATKVDREATCSEIDAEGYFTATVSDLAPDTDYWFAGWASNAKTEKVETAKLQRTQAVSKPSVVNATMRVGFEILDHLVLKGQITSSGGLDVSDYGFYWGEGSATNRVQASDVDKEGYFTVTLDAPAVQPLSEYIFAAYAVNEKGETKAAETTVRTGLVDRRSVYTQYLLDEKMEQDASGRQLVYFTLPAFEVEVEGVQKSITFLDRNLGATELPADAVTQNFAAAGSYFQWGTNQVQASSKLAELRAQTGNNDAGAWNGYGQMTCYGKSLSASDTWSNLVETGAANVIAPCPEGWRLPTVAEWSAVFDAGAITDLQSAYERLNISMTGDFSLVGVYISGISHFWTDNGAPGNGQASFVNFLPGAVKTEATGQKRPKPIRCVKVE